MYIGTKRDMEKAIKKAASDLMSSLKPGKLGRDDAMRELPKSDSTGLSRSGKFIKHKHEEVAGNAYEHYNKVIQTALIKVTEYLQIITNPPFGDVVGNLKQIVAESYLMCQRSTKKAIEDKVTSSKMLSAILDEGKYVKGSASRHTTSYTFVLISVYLLVESTLNAYFFGQGSMHGLLGGFIVALSISLISIGASFGVGIIIGYLYDTNRWGRNISVSISIIYVASMFVYHSTVGWYRHCLEYKNTKTAMFDALTNFSEHGLLPPEIYSCGLMIIGLLFAFIAFYHGLRYKNVSQFSKGKEIEHHHDIAYTKLNDIYQKHLNTLSAATSEQLSAVDNITISSTRSIGDLNSTVIEIQSIIDKYKGFIETIIHSYIDTIGKFRSSNEKVRRTPDPDYFSEKPEDLRIKDFNNIPEALKLANEVINDIQTTTSQIQKNAKETKDIIRACHKDYIDRVPVSD